MKLTDAESYNIITDAKFITSLTIINDQSKSTNKSNNIKKIKRAIGSMVANFYILKKRKMFSLNYTQMGRQMSKVKETRACHYYHYKLKATILPAENILRHSNSNILYGAASECYFL